MSVNPDQDQHRRNRLLAALRPRDYALLEPHLQIVPIGEGSCTCPEMKSNRSISCTRESFP